MKIWKCPFDLIVNYDWNLLSFCNIFMHVIVKGIYLFAKKIWCITNHHLSFGVVSLGQLLNVMCILREQHIFGCHKVFLCNGKYKFWCYCSLLNFDWLKILAQVQVIVNFLSFCISYIVWLSSFVELSYLVIYNKSVNPELHQN